MRIEWAYFEGKRLRIELRPAVLMKTCQNRRRKKKTDRACCTAKSCNPWGYPSVQSQTGLNRLGDTLSWHLKNANLWSSQINYWQGRIFVQEMSWWINLLAPWNAPDWKLCNGAASVVSNDKQSYNVCMFLLDNSIWHPQVPKYPGAI